MATINTDPNKEVLDSIDSMFNRIQMISPFNEMGGIMAVDVPAEMSPGNGQIQPVGFIEEGAISDVEIQPASLTRALFADTIKPPEVVTSLPTLPDAEYPVGCLVFLTLDAKLYRNLDGSTWSVAVDGADIEANTITAGSIAAGAIGADELAAELVLASVIKTADSGARLELDIGGLRSYNSSEELEVQIPTDGSAVYVKGQIQATELIVLGDAVLRGDDNLLSLGSQTILENSQQDPSQAPSLFTSHDTTSAAIVPDDAVDLDSTTWDRAGLHFDPNGGANGTTDVVWTISIDNLGSFYLVEMLAADLTVNRYVHIADADLGTAIQNVRGVTRMGDYVYVVVEGFLDFATEWVVARYHYDISDAIQFDAAYHSVSWPVATQRSPVIASDGTNIYIADKSTGTNTIKINTYNATMVKQGSTLDTSHSPASGVQLRDMAAGNFDFGAARFCISTSGNSAYLYTSAGTHQSNETFPVNGGSNTQGGLTYGDFDGSGDRFWSMSGSQNGAITKHTNWVWTSASSIYWVAYSWYDSVATTHESLVGPRASITMGRRQQLNISTADIPGSGGADEPDNVRIYMFPNATSPATTSLDLQATSTNTNVRLETYDSGGAAPPVANDFPAGTPALLQSEGAEWVLAGDGSAEFADLTITGDVNMAQAKQLLLASTVDVTLASSTHPLQIGNSGGDNLGFDNNEIMARSNGAVSTLYLNKDGGDVSLGDTGVNYALWDADGNQFLISGSLETDNGGSNTIRLSATGNIVMTSGYIEMVEISGPAAPSANTGRIYVDDNGAGKSRLRVRFASGAVQTIATEP